MHIVIYHNPKCGTSRTVLASIRQSGQEPTIVDYINNPPSADILKELIAAMGFGPRDLLRTKETLYRDLGLDDLSLSDDTLIAAMAAHPILINRPIVQSPRGTRLCRPAERVMDLLDSSPD